MPNIALINEIENLLGFATVADLKRIKDIIKFKLDKKQPKKLLKRQKK
jgi:hypothetical protein